MGKQRILPPYRIPPFSPLHEGGTDVSPLSKGGSGDQLMGRRGFLSLLALAGASGILPGTAFAGPLITNKFVFARLRYQGGDWDTDMRGVGLLGGSELQLLERLVVNTRVAAEVQEFVISPADAMLGNYPFLYITGHSGLQLTRRQIEHLRAAILAGGFLLGDDCEGRSIFRRGFVSLMDQMFPEQAMEILPMSHPLFHCLYDIDTILGGDKLVHDYMEGITLGDRLAVLYTDNDLGCAWEGHPCRPHGEKQRENAFRLGMNIIAYALTH